ncbi:uncharacterized protein FIBRA_05405 [Fibroporia radiculosa]|uniref:WW domain-containing protein n=1 Tax=Fibroporia radiculosa TaxID=599839 RepID=J4HXG6_9APHY|nr:uncharacterized protein FIBRA_05405 [Fibroporia radiculosa]CCM03277.1 predicted protein [Fibroporia radiculosa]
MAHLQVPANTIHRPASINSERTLTNTSGAFYPNDCAPEDYGGLRSRSQSPSNDCPPTGLFTSPLSRLNSKLKPPSSETEGISVVPHSNAAVPSHNVVTPGVRGAPTHVATPLTYIQDQGYAILATSPEQFSSWRYNDRTQIPESDKDRPTELATIPAMQFSFVRQLVKPPWVAKEHPGGQLYFTKCTDDGIRIFTDNCLEDINTLAKIDACAKQLIYRINEWRGTSRGPAEVLEDIELVLDVREVDGETEWSYYLASLTKCSIFWLDEVNVDDLSQGLRFVFNLSDLRDHHVNQANQLLNYTAFDSKTSATSTAALSYEYLTAMSDCVKNATVCGLVIIEGVVINYFQDWEKFLNYHGQPEARLDQDRSVMQSTKRERTWRFLILSALLFFMPDDYLDKLQKLWIDKTINHVSWQRFISEMQKDWENSITPATVLLTANVGLLAIQSIDTGHPARSVAQIASYISTYLSLGNILLCTVLSKQHRNGLRESVQEAAEYFDRRSRVMAGLAHLAIIFSLPDALFMWG